MKAFVYICIKAFFMNIRQFIILVSILIGLTLTVGGVVVAVDDLYISPKGHLFEGVMSFALGVITLLLVIVGSAIGNLITVYSEVLQKQIVIQKEMHEEFTKRNAATGTALNTFFSGLMPGNMSITGSIEKKPIDAKNKKSSKDMTLSELEKELAKALSDENFEKATEINKAIKQLKNPDNPES